MASITLGLLADTTIQLSNLESIVRSAQLTVSASMLARPENLKNLPTVDMWVVRIDMEDERSQATIERLDALDIPIIYDEADSYSSLDIEERARRFSKKIEACGIRPTPADAAALRASYVWVLAASAGGPEAVNEFIKHVPQDLGDVAFVYVQHMDEVTSKALRKSLERNTAWRVQYCTEPSAIYEKTIFVVSPSFQLEFNDVGLLCPSKAAWKSPYSPSVDHVVAKIWRRFGKKSGVIVFSGMGNDGAKTCRMIKNAGGQVWVQSLESCAVDSMPREVINTGCVSYTGTPAQLARHLIFYHNQRSEALKVTEPSHE